MPKRAAPSTASATPASAGRLRVLIAAAALACFAGTVLSRGFIRDDRALIAENPLLRQGWRAAPRLFTTGYWEAALGASAPIQEYRPLTTLSFLIERELFGARPGPMHAANALLHAAVCLLLFACLRRRLPEPAAGAAALVFAVLPAHAEAVSYLTSRSELFCALSLLGCWLLTGGRGKPRLGFAALCFTAGLLSKESAAVIPAFLLLEDWVFEGRRPWDRERRGVTLMLAGVLAAYAAARFAVVPRSSAGAPFFASRLDALRVWPAWTLKHYLWPAATGLGLCADFSRAGGPLSLAHPSFFSLWLAPLLLLPPLAAAAFALKRKRWAFWLCGPLLFLLPTCPLLVPLDTIGAERFLYLPTLALAAGAGLLYARARAQNAAAARLALGALCAWYGGVLLLRNRVWLADRPYYEAACACNPASAKARTGLGEAKVQEGDFAGAQADWERASALDPALATPVYDRALLAFNSGDAAAAEQLALRAVKLEDGSSDAWLLLGLSLDQQGRRRSAEAALRRSLAILPDNAAARLDLGRLLAETGRPAEAATHLRRFVELAPDDPGAPAVAAALAGGRR